MKTLKDSSEIAEAARLFADLLRMQAPEETKSEATDATKATEAAAQRPAPKEPLPEFKPSVSGYRSEQLEHALEVMCKRGGFVGAVIADMHGFALAVYNSPVESDALAAFTTVLGDALERAAYLLNQHGADNISMDINYVDKVVLKRFKVAEGRYFLMVICPQGSDERGEVELSIEQIISILS